MPLVLKIEPKMHKTIFYYPDKGWKENNYSSAVGVKLFKIHYVRRQYGDFRDHKHYSSSEATQKACQLGPKAFCCKQACQLKG